jgi:hypothetical protein
MKLCYFDDFRLGVVKGDAVVDVSAVVQAVPHTGPHNLISGLIERFADYRKALEEAAASGKNIPLANVRIRPHRLHGRQLHGGRHAQRAGTDQRLSQIAQRHHRQ